MPWSVEPALPKPSHGRSAQAYSLARLRRTLSHADEDALKLATDPADPDPQGAKLIVRDLAAEATCTCLQHIWMAYPTPHSPGSIHSTPLTPTQRHPTQRHPTTTHTKLWLLLVGHRPSR